MTQRSLETHYPLLLNFVLSPRPCWTSISLAALPIVRSLASSGILVQKATANEMGQSVCFPAGVFGLSEQFAAETLRSQ